MEVKNCKNCGRLFNVMSDERICPACEKKLEEKFQEVKAYLDENRGASVEELSREKDVSTKQIKIWIKQERLILSDGSLGGITCEKCGKPICTGRFCDGCKKNMADSLQDAVKPRVIASPKMESDHKNKMRFLN